MRYLIVVIKRLAGLSIESIDTDLQKANGPVWHTINEERYSILSWHRYRCKAGYSQFKGWVFRYKLHLIFTTRYLVVPQTAAVITTANIPDNQMYVPLTFRSFSSVFSLPSVLYIADDLGYDDKKLYEYSKKNIWNRSSLSCC